MIPAESVNKKLAEICTRNWNFVRDNVCGGNENTYNVVKSVTALGSIAVSGFQVVRSLKGLLEARQAAKAAAEAGKALETIGEAAESAKAPKPNLRPMSEAELEQVVGGAKDPNWEPPKNSTKVPGSAIDEEFAKAQYRRRINQTPLGKGEKARGFWTGERGESMFIPNNPEIKELLKKYNLEGIPYKNAEVDFSRIAEHQVTINGMAGGKNSRYINYGKADEELAKILDMTKGEVESYRKRMKLTWHECNDMKTMQLVPSKLNKFFTHAGGVGEINLLFDLLEGLLK